MSNVMSSVPLWIGLCLPWMSLSWQRNVLEKVCDIQYRAASFSTLDSNCLSDKPLQHLSSAQCLRPSANSRTCFLCSKLSSKFLNFKHSKHIEVGPLNELIWSSPSIIVPRMSYPPVKWKLPSIKMRLRESAPVAVDVFIESNGDGCFNVRLPRPACSSLKRITLNSLIPWINHIA